MPADPREPRATARAVASSGKSEAFPGVDPGRWRAKSAATPGVSARSRWSAAGRRGG
jgi:hypothetical protein